MRSFQTCLADHIVYLRRTVDEALSGLSSRPHCLLEKDGRWGPFRPWWVSDCHFELMWVTGEWVIVILSWCEFPGEWVIVTLSWCEFPGEWLIVILSWCDFPGEWLSLWVDVSSLKIYPVRATGKENNSPTVSVLEWKTKQVWRH